MFRIVWYAAALRPGVILVDHSEAESKTLDASAEFQLDLDGKRVSLQAHIRGDDRSVELTVSGDVDGSALESYVDGLTQEIESLIKKFAAMDEATQQRVDRALLAKACWDRVIAGVLKKSPSSDIYFQLAHGREMIIKATEGEDVPPMALTTSSWISNIESLPQDEPLPASVATDLAKKCVEWKKETLEILRRYL